jgi:hypothetical protein
MKGIRLIGLAVMAVCATSAIAPASALEPPYQFRAETYPVEVKGVNTNAHRFEFGDVVIECSKATFSTNEEIGNIPNGEAINPTSSSFTLTTHPTYTDCTGTLGAGSFLAEVKTGGCNFKAHVAEPRTKGGFVDIICGQLSRTAEVTEKSAIVVASTKGIFVGMEVTGTKFAGGTEVARVGPAPAEGGKPALNEGEIELSTRAEGLGTATTKTVLTFRAPGVRVVFLGLNGCTVIVYGRGGGLSGVEYVNEAPPPKKIKVNSEAEIRAKATSRCALTIGTAEFSGTYRGSAILNGFKPGTTEADGIQVSR